MRLRKTEVLDIYPLSPMQEGLLFHALHDADSTAYMEQMSLHISGRLERSVFEAAWHALVARHDILRTLFIHEKVKRPLQVVLKRWSPPIQFHDLRSLSGDAQKKRIEEIKRGDRAKSFRLEREVPIRLRLFRLADDSHLVLWSYHHILLDGWCLGIVHREFAEIYQSLRRAGAQDQARVPRLQQPRQFGEYIKWLESRDSASSLAFWKRYLSGFDTLTALPGQTAPAEPGIYQPGERHFVLSAETTDELRRLAAASRVTVGLVVQALWGVLLGRLNDCRDVVFGLVVSGRPPEMDGVESMLGLFINTVPVRVRWDRGCSFVDLLAVLRQESLQSREHHYSSLAEIQAGTNLKHKLFDNLMLIENLPVEQVAAEASTGDFVVDRVELEEHTHFAFNCIVNPGPELRFKFGFDASVCSAAQAESVEGCLLEIIRSVTARPDGPISELSILPPAEARRLRESLSATSVIDPAVAVLDGTIHQAFARVAMTDAGRVAVECAGRSWSYGELDRWANGVAQALRKAGVGLEDRVALVMDRSQLLVAGLLGILKSGGCYVPIDPHYPAERVDQVLADSGCRAVVTSERYFDDSRFASLPRIEVGRYERCAAVSADEVVVAPENLAYVIYTSGSTGRPKGVMVEHRNVLAFHANLEHRFGLRPQDTLYALTTSAFDISVLELVCSLLLGMRVVVATDEEAQDARTVVEQLRRGEVTVLQATPSRLAEVVSVGGVESLSSLRVLLVGGESLPLDLHDRLARLDGVHVFNVYGPTEATIWSTAKQVRLGEASVGRPLLGESVFILSRDGGLLPVGVSGEICIGGSGLGRGYLGRGDLTASNWMAHPFADGERLYRTGDLGRWLPSGEVEILGRSDSQVKVRGHRIELGEIEAALSRHAEIDQSVVVVRGPVGESELVAYVVGAAGLTVAAVQTHLRELLPSFMVPTRAVFLDELPLTPNGKVDRRKLPEPDQVVAGTSSRYVAPRDELEQQLAAIWQSVLGLERVGINDDFFEIGGHSLKATQIASRIYQQLGVRIALRDILRSSTVSVLTIVVKAADTTAFVPITRVAESEHYAVSHTQRRLWVLSQFEDASAAYNMPMAFLLAGHVDASIVQQAFELLISRHETLRTTFVTVAGEPRQKIHQNIDFNLRVENLAETADPEQAAETIRGDDAMARFDLATGPLLRAALLQLGPQRSMLTLNMHHIISDGWSLGILAREFCAAYSALLAGTRPELAELPVQYRDYAQWQNDLLNGPLVESQRAFWQRSFAGGVPLLDLPLDYPRPASQTFSGAAVEFSLDLNQTTGLEALGHDCGASLFMSLLTVLNVVLYRYTGQKEIVVGTPHAGRDQTMLEHQIGPFINSLALLNRLDVSETFRVLLQQVSRRAVESFDHHAYPFDRLVDELELPRDLARSPLFDVMLDLDESPSIDVALPGVEVLPCRSAAVASKFDLSFSFRREDGGLKALVVFNPDLMKRERIERLGQHFRQIVDAVVADPDRTVGRLHILPDSERRKVLVEFNSTAFDYPGHETLVGLFEAVSRRYPQRMALSYAGRTLSYRQLNLQSNRIAHELLERYAVVTEDRVGLAVGRSEWLIVAMLGILKAGCAYVPVEIADPAARRRTILQQAGCRVVVVDATSPADWGEQIEALDVTALKSRRRKNPAVELSPGNLAYAIFTSGSTGRPKGVMVEHRSVVNLVHGLWQRIYADCGAGPLHIGLVASHVFDASVQQIFAALLGGHQLFVLDETTRKNGRLLGEYLQANEIGIVDFTPSSLGSAMESGLSGLPQSAGLRHLIVGGEVLSPQLVGRFWQWPGSAGVELTNIYGPTECTVDALAWRVDRERAPSLLPIGSPLANVQALVLDEDLAPVAIGVSGEIYLSGDGVARGYAGQAGLTAERFVPHPYRSGQRLYRTGDRGRWRRDGQIEPLGRRDHQVKIRGHRIELGEVEHALLSHPGVIQAVVTAQPVDGSLELVGYAVVDAGIDAEVDAAALRRHLRGLIPHYMMPSRLVLPASLPMTASGKVDRRALPAAGLEAETIAHPHVAPRDQWEQSVQTIWSEVLGLESPGVEDDFFALGGHSLKAIQIATRVHRDLGVEIGVREVFAGPTIAELAAVVRQARPSAYGRIARVATGQRYALSPAQRRLWVLDQMEGGTSAYNMPGAYRLNGELDAAALEGAFAALLQRHESLRTVFELDDGQPRARVLAPARFELEVEHCEGWSDSQLQSVLAQAASHRFDLSRGPLMRVRLLRLSPASHVLFLNLHHIVADGWSMDVLVRDLSALYESLRSGAPTTLSALRIAYRDYAAHQNDYLETAGAARSRAYWHDKLSGELGVLDLPGDRSRPRVKSYAGQTLSHRLEADRVAGLRRLGQTHGASLFMVLLALVKVLLHRYTGQDDVIVGTPVAGRSDAELEDQIGFYVGTLALRDRLDNTDRFIDVLERVRTTVTEAMAHQDYPFDRLVDELELPRDLARSPIFDVMVVYQSDLAAAGNLGAAVIEPVILESEISKFDLTFHFGLESDRLEAAVEYSTEVFEPDRIARMHGHFQELVTSALEDPDQTIGALCILSDSEREQLIGFCGDVKTDAAAGAASQTLGNLVAGQARKTPSSVALIHQHGQLTYRQLLQRADRLAAVLQARETFRPGQPVALLVERSQWSIVGLLAILRAGGIYLPVDSASPAAHVRHILCDSGCGLVIADEAGSRLANDLDIDLVLVSDILSQAAWQTERQLSFEVSPDDPAYLIYTSGSTGKPKGVLIAHRGFINMSLAQIETFGITEADRVLLFASAAFDASLSEIFMALLAGAAIVTVDRATITDPQGFVDYLQQHGVTVATLPPAYLRALNKPELSTLRVLITAGEAAIAEDVRHYASKLSYFNAYGPTEASVCASIHLVDAKTSTKQTIPIGRPIQNTSLFILDENLSLVPIGITGEIFIAGRGLARCYWNQARQTALAFLPHPFARGERLYRSGDRGYWNTDGELVFCGRQDDQLKIRGHRVEPAELEHCLRRYPAVSEAVVTASTATGGGSDLVAYVVCKTGIDKVALREFLAEQLPEHLIPGFIVELESLPLNSSGKIDKRALPSPEQPDAESRSDYVAPRNPLEANIAEVWEEVLGRSEIGIHDHFFMIGGDSIKFLQVVSRLHERSINLRISDVYRHPTIAALAGLGYGAGLSIDQGPVSGNVPLSPVQSWFFSSFRGNRDHFNQAVLLRSARRIDADSLRTVLAALIAHHDALRSRFSSTASGVTQEIVGISTEIPLQVLDLRQAPDWHADFERAAQQAQRSLNLERGPIVRVVLFRLPEDDRLLFVVHHVAIDGVSWRILLQDLDRGFSNLLQGKSVAFPPKTHSFKIWEEHLHAFSSSEVLLAEVPYWQETLAGAADPLPGFAESAAGTEGEREVVHMEHDADSTAALLGEVNQAYDSTTLEILLCALQRSLRDWTGSRRTTLRLEGHGREDVIRGIDVSRTVGWFTSMFPITLDLEREDDLAGEIRAVRRTLRTVPNRGIGFGILGYLTGSASAETFAFEPEITFNYLGRFERQWDLGTFELASESHGDTVDPEALCSSGLEFLALIADGKFQLSVSYDTGRFGRQTMEALMVSYGAHLREIIDHCRNVTGAETDDPGTDAIRPYGAMRSDTTPILLSSESQSKIFVMPPLFGYGAAFRDLALRFPDDAWYAFDFSENDDRLSQYAQQMTTIQPNGSFVLFGYSGGGNLAFEVAKELEAMGRTVSDIIMVDSPMTRQRLVASEEEIRETIDGNLEYFRKRMESHEDYRVFLANEFMKALMLRKMEAFLRYLNGLINEGVIGANIHFIKSAQDWADPADIDAWVKHTTGELKIYQGKGDHSDMTDERQIDANAALLAEIVAGIRRTEPDLFSKTGARNRSREGLRDGG